MDREFALIFVCSVLVIGAKNSGKTSFISFLRHSLALPAHKQPYTTDKEGDSQVNATKSSFTSHYLETEMDGERVGVTLWDSAGLEKHIIDLQLREMSAFVESKFEETFLEEQKVMRSPGVKDTHIHCVLLVLDPVRLDSAVAASVGSAKGAMTTTGGLDGGLDLQVMRALWGKTTVIPVIAKADTLTAGHMSFLKRAVWDSLKSAKLDPLEALELEGDEEDEDILDEEDEDQVNGDDPSDTDSDVPVPKSKRNGHNRQSSLAAAATNASGDDLPYIPMSILSPDLYDLPPYAKAPISKKEAQKIGRRFPWGFADPYDPEHCDFMRLRDSIFSEWRADLRDLARTKWYENWRTSRLKNLPGSKQRVRGGVTPVAAVPREGRTTSGASLPVGSRNVSGAGPLSPTLGVASSVPRSVSGSTMQTQTTAIGLGQQQLQQVGLRGLGSDAGSVSSRGAATYRSTEAAQ
jgi:septin family protein